MSIKIMNRVWQDSQSKGSERLVLLAIADNADDRGHGWPSLSHELADKTKLTRQSVAYNVDKLAVSGEIGVYPMPGSPHSFIVFTGMEYTQIREAIKALAARRKCSPTALNTLRRTYRADAQERIDQRRGGVNNVNTLKSKKGVNKLNRGRQHGLTAGVKSGVHEPSVTVREPSVPKGIAAGASRPPNGTPKPKAKPKRKPLWEALLKENWGITYDPDNPIAIDTGPVNKTWGELRKLKPIPTPEEYVRFMEDYRANNKDKNGNPLALRSWQKIPLRFKEWRESENTTAIPTDNPIEEKLYDPDVLRQLSEEWQREDKKS